METVDFNLFKSLVKSAPALLNDGIVFISSGDVNDLFFREDTGDDSGFAYYFEFSEKDFEAYSKFPVLYDRNTNEFHFFKDQGHGVKDEYVVKILHPVSL